MPSTAASASPPGSPIAVNARPRLSFNIDNRFGYRFAV
jgi:hypothetical protein